MVCASAEAVTAPSDPTFPLCSVEDAALCRSRDDLTGLGSRRAVEVELERAILHADQVERLLAVCLIDLDAFRPINDTYGSETGDQVLREIAHRLQASVRSSDFVARLGGDEFVLLLRDLANLDDLEEILARIATEIGRPLYLPFLPVLQIEASFGIVLYPLTNTENPDVLLRWADQALYVAKSRKEDRLRPWAVYGERIPVQFHPYQRLLRTKGLIVRYQPITDNRTGAPVGVEALARLLDTEGNEIAPGQFLPLFDETDFALMLDLVLDQVIRDLPYLQTAAGPLWVSINLHPSSMAPAILTKIQGRLAAPHLDPSRFVFEILEESDFLNTKAARTFLLELRAAGVRIALDDVGSAYSSLLRMKTLPIDKIKLDQGFVRSLARHPGDLHFVLALHELALALRMELVLEGVETPEIQDALSVLQSGYLQGYAIARPLLLSDLRVWLSHSRNTSDTPPASLLGLYAHHVLHHQAVVQLIRIAVPLDPQCLISTVGPRVESGLTRLGFGISHPLNQAYQAYLRALEAIFSSQGIHPDVQQLTRLDQAHQAFLKAMEQTIRASASL